MKKAFMSSEPKSPEEKMEFAKKCDLVTNILEKQKKDCVFSPKAVNYMIEKFSCDGIEAISKMMDTKNSSGVKKFDSKDMNENIKYYSAEEMAKLNDVDDILSTNVCRESVKKLLNSRFDTNAINTLSMKLHKAEAMQGEYFRFNTKDLRYTTIEFSESKDGKTQVNAHMYRSASEAKKPDYTNFKELILQLDDKMKVHGVRAVYSDYFSYGDHISDTRQIYFDSNENPTHAADSTVPVHMFPEYGGDVRMFNELAEDDFKVSNESYKVSDEKKKMVTEISEMMKSINSKNTSEYVDCPHGQDY